MRIDNYKSILEMSMNMFLRLTRFSLIGIVAAVLGVLVPQTLWAQANQANFGTLAAYGTGALGSLKGIYSAALGYNALHNTTGSLNTASGVDALQFNTSGDSNTAIGKDALGFNTTGSYDTAVGTAALFSNTTGNYNTANGMDALAGNTSGSSNTAVGNDALYNSTGNDNIGLGDSAGFNITTGSNNIEIGNQGGSSDDGFIRIGSGQTTTIIAGIWNTTIPGGVPVYLNKYGHLGTLTSSKRFKEDIQTIGEASDKLLQLRPVSFRYKQAADDGTKPLQYGLIAEEVAKVYPELVQYDRDGKPYTVSYNFLAPLLLSELQKEHAANISQLEELVSQKAEITSLNQQLIAHRAEILAMSQPGPNMISLQQSMNELEELLQARAAGNTDMKLARTTGR